MKPATTGTQPVIADLQVDVDTLMGYPADPTGYVGCTKESLPPGFGRTDHHVAVRKHPDKEEYALEMDDKLAEALADPEKRQRLSAEKLAALEVKHVAAEELPEDWDGDEDEQ